jgi:ABC-2 type transport system permease protein
VWDFITGKEGSMMNRTLKVILAVIFIVVIMFSAISICQNLGWPLRWDVTEDKRNTLSDGTKDILAKLDQPIKMKLYYSRTAALKAPDWIGALNNHYLFVRSLLQEYVAESDKKIELEIIDPRQYSQDEADAEKRYQLAGVPLPGPEKGEIEKFFFGLVVQTQFGSVEKVPFFDPGRQNLVEYQISQTIELAINPSKKKIGILSSLEVMGTDPYMAYMMRQQGRQAQQPWWIVEMLKQQYEVEKVEADTGAIGEDIDMLLVIHPKDLEEKTLFAIDQFVLSGKKAMVFVDPFAEIDRPQQQMMMAQAPQAQSSHLDPLLESWGLSMPKDVYAADDALVGLRAWWRGREAMREQSVGYINLEGACLSRQSPITTHLGHLRMFFSGVLKPVGDENKDIDLKPLLSTTAGGNELKVAAPEVRNHFTWKNLNRQFAKGDKPVHMAYLVTGKLRTAFPDGIEVEDETDSDEDNETGETKSGVDKDKEQDKPRKMPKLTEADNCTVVVVADVDVIYDFNLARVDNFGRPYELTENLSFLHNAIEVLSGSSELIRIRSRGNMERRFVKVDKIEQQAQQETANKEADIRKKLEEIEKKRSESMQLKMEEGNMMLQLDPEKFQQAERERSDTYLELERQLRETMNDRREKIENMGDRIKLLNLISAPGIILIIAMVLGIYRNVKRRYYISHASDA